MDQDILGQGGQKGGWRVIGLLLASTRCAILSAENSNRNCHRTSEKELRAVERSWVSSVFFGTRLRQPFGGLLKR
jgi:hypothetical protein